MGVPYATAVEGGQLCGVCGVFVAEELKDFESYGNEGYWAHLDEVHGPELKKVKVAKSLSEDSTAFTADLWWRGSLIALVSNHGRGGNNSIRPATRDGWEVLDEFEAWCRTQPPRIDTDPDYAELVTNEDGTTSYVNASYPMDADALVDTLLDDYQEMQPLSGSRTPPAESTKSTRALTPQP